MNNILINGPANHEFMIKLPLSCDGHWENCFLSEALPEERWVAGKTSWKLREINRNWFDRIVLSFLGGRRGLQLGSDFPKNIFFADFYPLRRACSFSSPNPFPVNNFNEPGRSSVEQVDSKKERREKRRQFSMYRPQTHWEETYNPPTILLCDSLSSSHNKM